MTIHTQRLIASLAYAVALLPTTSCKRQTATPSAKAKVVRIDGVREPAEMLLPSDKTYVPTKQDEATLKTVQEFFKATDNVKPGDETSGLRALDAFIASHPRVGDAYPLRASLRCISGDFRGAKADIESALSGIPRIVLRTDNSDRNELLAEHAKIAFIAHDDQAAAHDLNEIINSYNDDFYYLTDGRVKITDKPHSPCGWTSADVGDWLARSQNSPGAQVFRVMFAAAHAPLDDSAKPLSARYAKDAMRANPGYAPAFFYAAEGVLKTNVYKELAFTDAERAAYHDHLIELWSKTIQLDPNIQATYAERANSYYQRKNYSAAIDDYDRALAMSPNDSGLLNDRGLAKEETYDKAGAIDDFTQAIALKTQKGESLYLANSLDNRADLYIKLKDYGHALDDYTSLIALKLHDLVTLINLDQYRKLYPEYAKVDDATLKHKLHRTIAPNATDADFDKWVTNPQGLQPLSGTGLRDAYLKRADTSLSLKRFDAAAKDYARAEVVKESAEDRWRTPPGLNGMSVDLQTLEAKDSSHVKVWMRPAETENQTTESRPTLFAIDCKAHTIRTSVKTPAYEPEPGSYAENVRDFFCAPSR